MFFYSGDRDEPRHVHVEREASLARAEIRRVEALVRDNASQLRRAWDEYFTE